MTISVKMHYDLSRQHVCKLFKEMKNKCVRSRCLYPMHHRIGIHKKRTFLRSKHLK
mgnify:CR=1 FL=1